MTVTGELSDWYVDLVPDIHDIDARGPRVLVSVVQPIDPPEPSDWIARVFECDKGDVPACEEIDIPDATFGRVASLGDGQFAVGLMSPVPSDLVWSVGIHGYGGASFDAGFELGDIWLGPYMVAQPGGVFGAGFVFTALGDLEVWGAMVSEDAASLWRRPLDPCGPLVEHISGFSDLSVDHDRVWTYLHVRQTSYGSSFEPLLVELTLAGEFVGVYRIAGTTDDINVWSVLARDGMLFVGGTRAIGGLIELTSNRWFARLL